MKQIPLKTVEIELEEGFPTQFSYRDGLIDVLRVRAQGMDMVEMEKALACIGKLKRATDSVLLEDDEHAYLSQRVREYKWRIADTAILQFSKEVLDAKAPPEKTPND